MQSSDGQSAVWHIGDVIDDQYEVTGLLGAGGMGTVHKVRHHGWGTDLAVKSPKPGWFSAQEDVDRFVTEAQTWVKLGLHPNVCGFHYARELDGIPRLFAEYVPGGSLRERIDDGSLYAGDPERVTARLLRIASQMASGLEHAHSQEVLHRDMKPANVLLDDGDTGDSNSGSVKVTDFGLAYARAAAARDPGGETLAAPGNSLMTPAYASPEQARGEPVGRRSDIYSFAASVLDMFNGGVSWGPRAAGAFLAQLLRGDALPDGIPMPEGLARLLKHCLHDNHRDRPESMAEVAGELAIVYSAVVPAAAPLPAMPGAVELRAAEHNNRAVSLLDLGDRDQAEKEFRIALNVDPQHLDALYNSGLLRWRQGLITDDDLLADIRNAALHTSGPQHDQFLLAHVHAERGDVQSAQSILENLVREQSGDPGASQALSVLESLGTSAEASHVAAILWCPESGPPYERFRFSRDGTHAVTGNDTGGCLLWDIPPGDDLRRPPGDCLRSCAGNSKGVAVWQVDVTADQRFGTGVLRGEHARVWDFTTGRSLHLYPPDERLRIATLRVAPDGSHAYGIAENGELLTWNLRRGQPQPRGALLTRFQIGTTGTTGRWALLDVNADGSVLLAAVQGVPGHYRLARLESGTTRGRVLDDSLSRVRAMAMTSTGQRAVTAHDDHRIRIWDLDRGEIQREITTSDGITALAISDDARWALSGGEDGAVRVWDLVSGRCQRTFHGHHNSLCAVWISSDGQFGRSASSDNAVRSWSLRFPARYRAPLQLSQPFRTAQVSRAGGQVRSLIGQAEDAIASADYAAAVGLLDQARAVRGHERSPRLLAAWRELTRILPRASLRGAWPVHVLTGERSPLTEFFVSISDDAKVGISGHGAHASLWNLDDGTQLRNLPVGTFSATLTSDARRIVCATLEDTIEVCSVATGARLRSLAPPSSTVLTSVSATADGTRVLLGYQDGTLQLWDTNTSQCLLMLPRHDTGIRVTWIDPAGTVAVSASDDEVRMWDLHGGECLLKIPIGQPQSVCMSPSTRNVVVTSVGRSGMRMWNSRGEIVHEFDQQPAGIMTAEFSPEGHFIFAGDVQGSISVWDSGTGACVRTIEGHRDSVCDIRLTPDGCYALSGSFDGATRLWELEWDLNSVSAARCQEKQRK
jgi:WD40 repeat protein/serine/threonine protein kinase